MSTRRPRVKVQANLGNKRKATEDKKPVNIKEDLDPFKYPLSTITPSNINNNNDIPSNNILQKDMQSSNSTPPPSRRRRTSSSSSTTEEHLDLKPTVVSKIKSDLHLHIPPRVRTESSSSSHSVREPRIRTESGSSGRIRTESVSSNYSESHGPSRKSKMIRDVSNKDRSELTMFDLIYNYTPTANPMVKSEPGANMLIKSPPPIKTEQPVIPSPPVEETSATPILVPQLKIGLNGEVIIDEQSLEIQTTAEKEAKKVLSNSSCIFMDEFTGSNGFYKKQKRTKEWPESETIKFYKCLHTVGTDFTLMMTLFPNRNRRDLKLKFKKEERVNENLIKKALLYPKAFDIKELEKVLAADEEEKRRQEEEWIEIKKKKAASRKPKTTGQRKSKLALDLTEGEKAYKNEGVMSSNITRASKRVSPKVKKERSSKKVEEMLNKDFVQEEEETQSSVMEVDVSDLKSEYVREIADFKQEMEQPSELKEGEEIIGEFVPDGDYKIEGNYELEENGHLEEEEEDVPVTPVKNEGILDTKTDEHEIQKETQEETQNDDEESPEDSPYDDGEEDYDGESEDSSIENQENTSQSNHLNDDTIDDMTPEEIIACVANGSLAVVTSESEDGETVYEVYKMCPNSGELSDNPLNLHPEIINVIKMVV
ncbi:BDP1 family protein [Megaselia abdita]